MPDFECGLNLDDIHRMTLHANPAYIQGKKDAKKEIVERLKRLIIEKASITSVGEYEIPSYYIDIEFIKEIIEELIK